MLQFKENFQPEVFLLACILLFAYLVFPGPMKQLAKNKVVMLILLVLLTWYHAFLGFLLAALYLSLLHTSAGKEGFGDDEDDEDEDEDDDGDKKKKKKNDDDDDEDEDEDEKTNTQYPFAAALSNKAVSDAGQMGYDKYCVKGKLKEGINKDEIKKLKKQFNMSGCKDPCQKKCKFSSGGGKGNVKSGGGGSFGGF